MAVALVSFVAALLAPALASDLPWWKTSVVYQLYPRSFADFDGDGNGDLKGILQHADYLKDIGVDVVWVSPIYKSPMLDQGYDVSDFKDVNPMFGDLADAKALIKAFHDRGMKFLMDFVPNHTSEKHAWFEASVAGNETYKDFYVWQNPKGYSKEVPIAPNNWVSAFQAAPAWTYSEARKQFYLHEFGTFQPDLNYRNEKVLQGMYDCMKFWLDLGADGFRMDAVPYLVEDGRFLDEPTKDDCKSGDCNYHIYTQNQPETYKVLRTFVDNINRDFKDKFVFFEVYAGQNESMKYFYENSSPFNFLLITDVKIDTNATTLKNKIDTYMNGLPNGTWPNWVIGNHDQSRVGTRYGEDFIDAANMLIIMLPGTTITFQGEELGMVDAYIRPDQIKDPNDHRDPQRTPFQWNNTLNAGFSRNVSGTWLPVNPNFYRLNVELEAGSGSKSSHLTTYKRLLSLRKELVSNLQYETTTIGDWVFLLKRSNQGKTYYVLLNLNNVETYVPLSSSGFKDFPSTLYVHTPSINSGYKIGDSIDTAKVIRLMPRSGMVLQTTQGPPVSSSATVFSSLALIASSLALLLKVYC